MILNCTPPYSQHIPNPALGYLKGFLQSKGVEVTNVYWNLILAETISTFQKGLKEYAQSKDLFSILPVVYSCRQFLTDSQQVTPLDVLYSSIYSKEEIAEITHSARDRIDQYIRKKNLHKAGLSGFTVKTYQWLMSSYLIRRLKEMNPEAKVVIGGITNADCALKFMKIFTLADYAIYGEGEYPLGYLAEAVEEGTSIVSVPNLVYRDGSKIFSTGKTHTLPHLDSYPFADHTDYFKTFKEFITGSVLSEYIETHGRHPSDRIPVVLPILGSRSCPWNKCRFCVLNEEYSYRTRSPQNIVKEIEYQSETHGVNSFIFVDTELAGNVNRFKALLRLLMQSSADHKRRYRFFAEVSPIFITPETAQYMQLASFSGIQIGFEAMTDSLLEKMEKRHRFAHNIQALKLGTQYTLNIRGLNVIRGIPTETEEDILESCSNVKFLRFLLTTYNLSPCYLRLDKGAPFYNDVLPEERETWKNNATWTEVEPTHLIPASERFWFFGFSNSVHNRLWADFESLVKSYVQQNHSYEWIEYENGSFVEERGLRIYTYIFDQKETDLLIFCNTVKSFSEVKKEFSYLSEDDLREMLQDLKEAGLLYHDEDFNWIVSVLEAGKRKKFPV